MTKLTRRLGLAVLATGLTLGLSSVAAPKAEALTVTFVARAFTQTIRSSSADYRGQPVGSAFILPGADDEAIQVDYATSGLPYVISRIEVTASGASQFVGPADTLSEGFSFDPTALPVVVPGLGGSVSQDYGVGTDVASSDFQQGSGNVEVTYVEIQDAGGNELDGPDELLPFNGSTIRVFFTKTDLDGDAEDEFPLIPASFFLDGTFAVQTVPPGDPNSLDSALAGGSINIEVVPEPGTVALMVGMGIGGSSLLVRRRARK